jgi:hypothetical protein
MKWSWKITTIADKVKRIRHNGQVNSAPCKARFVNYVQSMADIPVKPETLALLDQLNG